jgi:hypothetical protein
MLLAMVRGQPPDLGVLVVDDRAGRQVGLVLAHSLVTGA